MVVKKVIAIGISSILTILAGYYGSDTLGLSSDISKEVDYAFEFEKSLSDLSTITTTAAVGVTTSTSASFVESNYNSSFDSSQLAVIPVSLERFNELAGFSKEEHYEIYVNAFYEEVEVKEFSIDNVIVQFSEWHDSRDNSLHVMYFLNSEQSIDYYIVKKILDQYLSSTEWYDYQAGYSSIESGNNGCSLVVSDDFSSINIGITIQNADINEGFSNVNYSVVG